MGSGSTLAAVIAFSLDAVEARNHSIHAPGLMPIGRNATLPFFGVRGRHGERAGGEDRRRACDAEGVVGDLPSHPICGYDCVSGRDLELASRGRSCMVGRRVKTNGEVTY